ncbi:MAG: hypothetical protein M1812_004024 [Candelaria pacifica]|nr:MAG: hypothetical protein M1812_004024 [Candelaria pacifica]
MLERAAGCIETNGRHLLRASKKSIKSRRMLHSTFWSHGAGDLDLPPWWTSIVQGALGSESGSESKSDLTNRYILSNPLGELALDFLYPAKTLAFIQKCSAYSPERWQCHRVIQSVKQSTRAYTSVAGEAPDPTTFKAEAPVESIRGRQRVVSNHVDTRSVLHEQLQSASVRDPDVIWQLYHRIKPTAADGTLLANILEFFASSGREIDTKRSTQVFESIPLLDRSAQVYRNVIESHLKLNNVSKANRIHQEALPTALAQGSVGSDLLLAYMIDRRDWSAAYDLWEAFHKHKPENFPASQLFNCLRNLSHIRERALSLAVYADARRQRVNIKTVKSQRKGMLKFVSEVGDLVLQLHFHQDYKNIRRLLNRLTRLGIATAEQYERLILGLLAQSTRDNLLVDRDSLHLSYELYQALKNTLYLTISRTTLKALLKSFCGTDNLTCMREIMDDWFRFYDGPDPASYRMLMAWFSKQGNVATVSDLSNAYSSRFPDDLKHLPVLLYAYARQGILEQTVSKFKEMSAMTANKLDLKCWNILLYAYAREDDVDGIFQCFNDLLSHGPKPDDYTFGTLMGACAIRGDLQNIEELLAMSDSYGSKRTVAMVDCLVMAQIKNDAMQDAEKVIEAAINLDLQGSRTRMWNYVLTAYAFRRDMESATRIHQRMQELGVPLDDMTYAALIQLLAMLGQADAADKLLRVAFYKDRKNITSFHYAIVMGGFYAVGKLEEVFQTYQRMEKAGLKPSAGDYSVLLKAGAKIDQYRINTSGSQEQQLAIAERILAQILPFASLTEVAAAAPRKGLSSQSINETYPALYFDYLIFVYGQRRAFDKVRELYGTYAELVKKLRPGRNVTPPLKLLCALMVSHLREEQWPDVEKCWTLAREQAMKLAKPLLAAAASEPFQALYHRRFILCPPLIYYLKALDEQGSFDVMRSTVQSLQQDGFLLNNNAWNTYIQILNRSYHHVEAFKLCEEWLMPGWLGWRGERGDHGGPIRRKQMWNLKSDRFNPGRLYPLYRTIVNLAGGLMDIRAMGTGDEGKKLIAQISESAPRTLDAVRSLPNMDDREQHDILKGF